MNNTENIEENNMSLEDSKVDTKNEDSIKDDKNEESIIDKKAIAAQERINLIKNEYIQLICRQTDLTEEEARNKLEENNYNYMLVLNEYFEIENKCETEDENKTTNQQIYGQIRNLMDTGAKKFRVEQERVEQIKKMNEMKERMMREKMMKERMMREKMASEKNDEIK